jgi:hypothetical protein
MEKISATLPPPMQPLCHPSKFRGLMRSGRTSGGIQDGREFRLPSLSGVEVLLMSSVSPRRRPLAGREVILQALERTGKLREALLLFFLRAVKRRVKTARSSGVRQKSWRRTSNLFSARPSSWSRSPASSACGQLFGGDLPLLQHTVNLLEARPQSFWCHLQRPKTHLRSLEVTVFWPRDQRINQK